MQCLCHASIYTLKYDLDNSQDSRYNSKVQGEPKGLVDETQYEEPQISILVLKARPSISNEVRYHSVNSV